MKRFLGVVLTVCVAHLFVLQPVRGQAPLPEHFEEWIHECMELWGIPGMAIAVVNDDSLVYAQGFGVQKLGSEDLVDEHTLFGIASVTKNITAASLALLVDEGLLDWDDRVSDYIQGFKLEEPWTTDEVRIRDLLTHRVGTGRMLGNRLQFMTREEPQELIYRMRYHEFEEPFRSSFVYSNMMYMVAGEVVAAVSGMPWGDFVSDRLFAPLGMERSNTSTTQIGKNDNAAWPHQYIEGDVQTIPRRNWDNAAPAGGVNASVYEVARWLRMQLGETGRFDGERIITTSSMYEMHRPQVTLPVRHPYGAQVSYGLGWRITEYEGERILSHGGATDGMNTTAAMLPERNLAIIVTTNVFNSFHEVVVNTLLDAYLDIAERDWNSLYWNSYQRRYNDALERRKEIERARKDGTETTLEQSAYTGVYCDDLYGKAEVSGSADGLEIRLWDDPDMVAELEHWHHDTFRAVWRNRALREDFLHFTLGRDGNIATLEFQFALRPLLLQVGAYPTEYSRVVSFERVSQ